MNTQHAQVAVVGGGASGLITARRLQERGIQAVVLEDHPRVGDCWRDRYDSLRLFSPRWASSLPGYPLPVGARVTPSRDRMADYLEEYVAHFAIPVRTGTRVTRLGREDGRFVLDLDTADGPALLTADRVVVATGAHRRPVRPPFAATIGSQVRQLHSLEYRSPADLAPGPVLVVGSGNSGTDIALEAAAAGHPTLLAGRFPGQTPVPIDTLRGFVVGGVIMFLLRHLTLRTPLGRAAKRRQTGHGLLLIRNKLADLDRAGVQRLGRVEGVREGWPLVDGAGTVTPATIVWCTGSRPDLSWIDLDDALDDDAEPRATWGVADAVPGLGFVGFDFQYSAASSTVQGMDRDVRYVLDRLMDDRSRAAAPPARAALSR
jgi:putative flavoprotein involved in K+ transport